jgi:membrane protein required for colicin V production
VNWVDAIILGVLGLSVLIGLWRGLVSEVLALAAWIAAFWVAWTFGPAVAAHFERSIALPLARLLVGYALCFLVVLLLGALLRFVVAKLVDGTGLSGTDRLLGMLFGAARGVLLVTLAVFLLGFTAFARDPWWHESMLLPRFQGVAVWLGQRMPESVRHYLQQPPTLDSLPTSPIAPRAPAPATSLPTAPRAAVVRT